MNFPDVELERRIASRLLDVLIRAGLVLAMAMLCYQIFSPFLTLMVWALILAVTLYPLHQRLACRMGGNQGWAATVMVLLAAVLIVTPTTVLTSSLGDSVHQATVKVDAELIGGVRIAVGDEVIDASVRGKLAAMATALKN